MLFCVVDVCSFQVRYDDGVYDLMNQDFNYFQSDLSIWNIIFYKGWKKWGMFFTLNIIVSSLIEIEIL